MKTVLTTWAVWAVLAAYGLPGGTTTAKGACISPWLPSPWVYLPPSIYVREQIPYFALHPPVYYSHPVRRPYGHLPYPYLPSGLAADRYGTGQDRGLRDVRRRAAGPVTILNPYVAPPSETGVSARAISPRRPQVSYPAKMADQPE